MARPSMASAEAVATVEEALAMGASVAQAAAAAGVAPRTLRRWMQDGLVIRRRLRPVPDPDDGSVPEPPPERGGRFSDAAIEEALVAAVLKASAVDWRAARFILQSRWPERWGAR